MTSRTTKQAARAYQKAHGVPYAEALRRVMEPAPSTVDRGARAYLERLNAVDRITEADVRAYQKAHGVSEEEAAKCVIEAAEAEALRRVMETETPPAAASPHEHIIGGVGVGKGARAEAPGKGPFVGVPIKSSVEPVRFDPMTWLETSGQFDGEGSDNVHFSVTGQLGSGSTAGARSRQSISFGTVEPASISSTLDHDASPVSWSPWKAQFEDRPPNVGIYGPHGHGKTTFLATLANRLKQDMPITVLTPFPETYPESQGKLNVAPFDHDHPFASDPRRLIGMATQWADEIDPQHVAADRLPLLFLDLQPKGPQHVHDLLQLLRTSSHAGLGIFYIGPDEKHLGSELRSFTDINLYLHRDRGNWIARNGETPLRLTELFPPEETFTGRH